MRFYNRLTHAVLRRPVELALAALIRVMNDVPRSALGEGHVSAGPRARCGGGLPSPSQCNVFGTGEALDVRDDRDGGERDDRPNAGRRNLLSEPAREISQKMIDGADLLAACCETA